MTGGVAAPAGPGAFPRYNEGGEDRLPLMLITGIALLTALPVVPDKLQALDLVLVAMLPFVAERVRHDRSVRHFCVALVVWSVGQQIADYVNGPGPRLSMQFVTAVTMLGIIPALFVLAKGDFRLIRLLVVGVGAGLIIQLVVVAHAPLGDPNSWKFGLNGPVAIVVLALTDLAWHRGRRLPSIVALVGIAVLGVATDHRHLAGIAALTLIVLVVRSPGDRYPRTFSVVAGILLLLAVLSGAFIEAAEKGVLGARSGGQIEQFGPNPVAILVNIRPEPFQELYIWSLHPVVGWGSLPRLDSAAYEGSKQFLQEIGVVRDDLDTDWLNLEVPGLSAHSQFADSLARAGLAALPFWLLVGALALRTGIRTIRFRSSPLALLWTVLVLWDAVFSPLTATSHIEIAAYVALALTGLGTMPGSEREQQP